VINTVVERDLTKSPPPFLDEALIGEFYKFPEMIDAAGEQLLDYAISIFNEMQQADIIVIGTPMHNFGISALLKAWIDQLVRVGVTYRFNEDGTRSGSLQNKKVYLAISSGGRLAYWPKDIKPDATETEPDFEFARARPHDWKPVPTKKVK
jgi:FMN-dependent NADH-azoreductase